MVVAQLVERSLPTPEVRYPNPVTGKIYIERLRSTVLKFDTKKRKDKRGREWGNFKRKFILRLFRTVTKARRN